MSIYGKETELVETRVGVGDEADIKMIAEARGLTLLEVVERAYRDHDSYQTLRSWAVAKDLETRSRG